MEHTGRRNKAFGIDRAGLVETGPVYWNSSPARLYEEAIRRGEGQVAHGGPLAVVTGQFTGRSARDKFIVQDSATDDTVWWDNNEGLDPALFAVLRADFVKHARGRELFVQDLYAGAAAEFRIKVRVIAEFAWHALFIRHLLRRPEAGELDSFEPDVTIINLPSFTSDPERHGTRSSTVIAGDFSQGLILIGNTEYAGEIKKSVFGVLNYILPARDVMPMHCSANVGADGDTALFFGLSGTGKTTLSSDPTRTLIGDDEHGWSKDGIFNFEGGCYAKTIRLSAEAEPGIYATTQRWGSVLENVVIDPESRQPDFDDDTLTENARVAYPIEYIPNASLEGTAPHPKNIIMLTADAFGVMPPISRLSPSQAMYHFLSGYTAKVAGTEKGVAGTEATFSTCFGAPFMPRHPTVYGDLLRGLITRHRASCWLVNTGWTGGAYGEGNRMPINVTRGLLAAALEGGLAKVPMRIDPFFGFEVPVSVPGIDSRILNPRNTWADAEAFDKQARTLVGMFIENFAKFEKHVDPDVIAAAPAAGAAA